MRKRYDTNFVKEGETEVLVFRQQNSRKGPGSKYNMPFYNPAMELNRDMSILVGQWLVSNFGKKICLLDGLAASGIRGIRLANEVEGNFDVTINDWDKQSFSLIKKNIQHNKLKNATASNKNLNQLLSESRYHYIDIDPFGSPVYFIDSAVRSIYNNGVIACTATDTAALCGVYPDVCLRRYGAMPFHSFAMHEIGLRILLGFVCRETVKYDKGMDPLVCYSTDHYFRIYIRVRNGKNHANRSISELSYINSDKISFSSDDSGSNIGPLWIGKIHNLNVVKKLRTSLFEKQLNTKHMLWKFFSLFEEEANAPLFFYTTEQLASRLKVSAPKMERLFNRIKNEGYNVFRTHFSSTGFKTNASIDIVENIFRNLNS